MTRQLKALILVKKRNPKYTIPDFFFRYSDLKASIGLNLDALFAGAIPNITPMHKENTNEKIMVPAVIPDDMPATEPNINAPETPIRIPIIPPQTLITIDSIRNCSRIARFLAPNAFLIPISLVLSLTETSIIFIIPIPPTTSEMAAIAPSAVVNVVLIVLNALRISC